MTFISIDNETRGGAKAIVRRPFITSASTSTRYRSRLLITTHGRQSRRSGPEGNGMHQRAGPCRRTRRPAASSPPGGERWRPTKPATRSAPSSIAARFADSHSGATTRIGRGHQEDLARMAGRAEQRMPASMARRRLQVGLTNVCGAGKGVVTAFSPSSRARSSTAALSSRLRLLTPTATPNSSGGILRRRRLTCPAREARQAPMGAVSSRMGTTMVEITIDHQTICTWAERHGGRPAVVLDPSSGRCWHHPARVLKAPQSHSENLEEI